MVFVRCLRPKKYVILLTCIGFGGSNKKEDEKKYHPVESVRLHCLIFDSTKRHVETSLNLILVLSVMDKNILIIKLICQKKEAKVNLKGQIFSMNYFDKIFWDQKKELFC